MHLVRRIAVGAIILVAEYLVSGAIGIGLGCVLRGPSRFGLDFRSSYQLARGQMMLHAMSTVGGTCLALLIVRCMLPQDVRLSGKNWIVILLGAIPMILLVHAGIDALFWSVGPSPP